MTIKTRLRAIEKRLAHSEDQILVYRTIYEKRDGSTDFEVCRATVTAGPNVGFSKQSEIGETHGAFIARFREELYGTCTP